MKAIAVFASGSGSNFEAIVRFFQRQTPAKAAVRLLVCDQPKAQVLKRAERLGIAAQVFSRTEWSSREAFEQAILASLTQANIDWIALAGFMRILGPALLQAYHQHILNIHPSLLPAFPGRDAVAQAFAYGVQLSGVTVHLVDEGIDTGPILFQAALPIDYRSETLAAVTARIHELEHKVYPPVIAGAIAGDYDIIDTRRIRWNKNVYNAISES